MNYLPRGRSEPTPPDPDNQDPDKPEPGPVPLLEAAELMMCSWEAQAWALHPDPNGPPPEGDFMDTILSVNAARILRHMAQELHSAITGSFNPGEYEPPWMLCTAVPSSCPNGPDPHPFTAPCDPNTKACTVQPWEGWRT